MTYKPDTSIRHFKSGKTAFDHLYIDDKYQMLECIANNDEFQKDPYLTINTTNFEFLLA